MVTSCPEPRTLADLARRLGDVPLERVLYRPRPGTATLNDVIEHERRTDRICELIDGVLVEKAPGFSESVLAAFIGGLLNGFVQPRNPGVVTGASGAIELMPDRVRVPDVAFTSWERMPGRRIPTEPIPRLVPDLTVEVLKASNTPGEMAAKRQDYFTAGVVRVWEVNPATRTVAVFTAPDTFVTLGVGEMLEGEPVLPGFALPVADLFAELDRQG